MATLKLQTNIPVYGVVKYMDYYPAKMVDGKEYGAQIALKGTWEGTGEAAIYLPHFLANDIVGAGLAHSDGEKVFQGQTIPQFRWSHSGRVQVLKAEDGRIKRTTVLAVDATGAVPAQAPVHRPTPTVKDATPSYGSVPGDPWSEIERQYERARRTACRVWGDNYDPQALVAAAATVFIEANKRGIAPPPVLPAQDFTKPPAALQSVGERMPWDKD